MAAATIPCFEARLDRGIQEHKYNYSEIATEQDLNTMTTCVRAYDMNIMCHVGKSMMRAK